MCIARSRPSCNDAHPLSLVSYCDSFQREKWPPNASERILRERGITVLHALLSSPNSLSLSLSLFAGAGPRSTIERPFCLAFVHSTVFFSVRGQRQTGSVRTNSDAEKEREEGRETQKKMTRAVNTHRNAYEKRSERQSSL